SARLFEVVSVARGIPPTARWFNPIAQPGWTTYMLTGPVGEGYPSLAAQRMQQFAVFYLPRPWPLWSWWLESGMRPIHLVPTILVVVGAATGGAIQVRRGLS